MASLKVFVARAKSAWLSNHCETSPCGADKPPCHDEPDPRVPLEPAGVEAVPVDPDPVAEVTELDGGSVTMIDCAALDDLVVWSVAVTVRVAVGCPLPLYDEVSVNPLFASAAVSVMLLPLKVL